MFQSDLFWLLLYGWILDFVENKWENWEQRKISRNIWNQKIRSQSSYGTKKSGVSPFLEPRNPGSFPFWN